MSETFCVPESVAENRVRFVSTTLGGTPKGSRRPGATPGESMWSLRSKYPAVSEKVDAPTRVVSPVPKIASSASRLSVSRMSANS